ncbi:MAG: tetratricopeptide repeat protein [Anaerolineales bacterium]|nr:tetratricopeptide repeat protein [Anaerolineales bacterium]
MLQLKTLGQVQVIIDGQPVGFKMSRAVGLLVYLVVNRERAHGREQLATLFWPEEDDRKARENFRQALYQLRRALGNVASAYLTISRSTVSFTPTLPYELDVEQFEQAIAAQAWETATAVYQGDFLETLPVDDSPLFGEWLLVQREQLHQQAVQAFLQAAHQAEAENNTAVAEQHTRHLLSLEPWHEEAHRHLMHLLVRRGQQNEALLQYERCVQILASELGVPPTAETTALYQQIRSQRLVTDTVPHNLSAPLTPLIGRDADLALLQARLQEPTCRLLTLIAPGGMGKTRLMQALGHALHAAPDVAQQYPDGIFWISLLDVHHAPRADLQEEIASHLLSVLPVSPPTTSQKPSTELLADALQSRQLLLLIDNWEHVLEGAPLLVRLLTAVSQLKIVNTSREPLNLPGEWLFELNGLEVPTNTQEPSGAIQLFLECARRKQADFQPTPNDWLTITNICRALEGHPLAIEMAAAWLRGLTLAEIADGVYTGLDLLSTTSPEFTRRHRDLRQVLSYSWVRLIPSQRKTLAQLSLFQQPFSRSAAKTVANATVVTLAALVMQTWLRRTADGRYELHELLRHFAHEQLLEQPDLYEQTQQAYIQEHLHLLQSQLKTIESAASGEGYAILRQHRADIEQAWEWAISEKWLAEIGRATQPLRAIYQGIGLLSDGIHLLARTADQVRQLPETPERQRTLALLLLEEAALRNIQVNCEPVPTLMVEALQIAESLADKPIQLRAYVRYGSALASLGDFAAAQVIFQKALALAQELQDWEQMIDIYMCLGTVSQDIGDFVGGAAHYHQAVRLHSQHESRPLQLANVRHNLAISLAHLGQYTEARRIHQQNLALWRSLQIKHSHSPFTIEGLGYVALMQNRLVVARLHLQTALQAYEKAEDLDGLGYAHLYLGHCAVAQGHLATAVSHYRAMLTFRQKMNYTHLLNQGWAGLADVARRQGNLDEALHFVERCMPNVLENRLHGEDVMSVYLVCYEVLTAVEDERATAVLTQAITQLDHQIEALADDPTAQKAFMQAVPSHRALLAAAAQASINKP